MGHRRVLNEGEGPAALPDAPRNHGSPVFQRRESSNWGHLALHLKEGSRGIPSPRRRIPVRFRFGAPAWQAEHMDAGSIPATTVAAHVFFMTTCQTTGKHQPSSAMVRPGAGLLSGGLQGSDLRQNHPDAPSTRGDDFRRWSNWVALTLWLPCVAPVAWV